MVGRHLLHYEITGKLGEGGMGVVYKARDAHLDRFVAIKVLPPDKVADPTRKARFVQEAKSASALNHPNIVTIYDISSDNGVDFIAMEYVDGRTLDQIIPHKGMRLNEALKIAIQIADALARAHAAGIIHRDLKPANIMVDSHGHVKVLDFGLAKLTEVAADDRTVTMKTEEGAIVGTATYMSPEQAEGKPVDARSDIFSFGAVLYEMVTGQVAFRGDSKMSTLGAIIHKEPEPLAAEIPADLTKAVARCLRKDPARRFQHMDDLQVALDELKEESDSGKLAPAQPELRRRRWLGYALGAAALLVLAVSATLLWIGRSKSTAPERALEVKPLTTYPGREHSPSLSPDGSQVAFVWRRPGQRNVDIFVKQIGVDEPFQLTNTPEFELSPAWSPDGLSIAFLRPLPSGRWGVLLIPQRGGPERVIADFFPTERSLLQNGLYPSLAWMPDSKALAVAARDAEGESTGIWTVSAQSGEKRRITTAPERGTIDYAPTVSPDGRVLVFTRTAGATTSDLYRLSLSETGEPLGDPVRLQRAKSHNWGGTWTKDGAEIIFSAGADYESSLYRMAPEAGSKPRRIAVPDQHASGPSASLRGDRLVYAATSPDTNIWRVRPGEAGSNFGEPERFSSSTTPEQEPDYSPDGRKVAFMSLRSGAPEIWISDSEGNHPVQVTSFGGPSTSQPRWSPDGRLIAFQSDASGNRDIYVVGSSGGAPKRLTDNPSIDQIPVWSHDGLWIYYQANQKIMKVAPAGGAPIVLFDRKVGVPIESPDGSASYFRLGWAEKTHGIYRAGIDGATGEQVAADVYRYMPMRVVNDGIYYVGAQRESRGHPIRFWRASDGKIATVAYIPMTPWWGLAISPDRSTILFSQSGETRVDLRLVENFR